MRIRVSWFFLLALVAIYLASSSAWETGYSAVAESLFIVGVLLAGLGAMGRLWCSLYIAGYKNRTLITDGPYSICRNPLYFFSFIGSVGVGMATETVTFPLLIALGFLIYYPAVIKGEESRLRSLHGVNFEQYSQRVPKFFPRLSLLVERDAGMVNLIVFRKHILSAIWFVWIPAGMECVEMLHENQVLPSYFSLY